MNQSPKKNLERLEKIENALRELAPDTVFGGVTLADFTAKVEAARTAREKIAAKEAELINLAAERDDKDADALADADMLIKGVIASPEYGDDSSLYEAMGFIRKSNRKSGLTRKTAGKAQKTE